jgi:lipoprotein
MKRLPTFLITLIILFAFGCGSKLESNKSDAMPQRRDTLIGKWLLVEYDSIKSVSSNDTIAFHAEGSFYRTLNEAGEWSYKHINPDSLIIYNKDFGEQRFRIIELTNDSLIIQLKENVIYGDTSYNGASDDIEKFIRID